VLLLVTIFLTFLSNCTWREEEGRDSGAEGGEQAKEGGAGGAGGTGGGGGESPTDTIRHLTDTGAG
jgi:hypothetical protein